MRPTRLPIPPSGPIIPLKGLQKYGKLGADSLDVVELVMAIEEEFEMEIEDQAASQIATVQDALDYIEGRWNKD